MAKKDMLPTGHPGEFIAEELQARNLTQADLAFILGWDTAQLNRLITGKTSVTAPTANLLSDALDVPAEFFLNLQNMYDLGKAERTDPAIKTRALWASKYPVREMVKMGWIEDGESSLFDLQMSRFFGKNRREDVPFIGNAPIDPHAAKKSSYDSTTPNQYAWYYRVRQIAKTVSAPEYSEQKLRDALPKLRSYFLDLDDLQYIPSLLLECGVRLILVEPVPGSKMDGVCLWIDDQPVIGLTNRLDRLDNLCFVLRHEIEHVLRQDGKELQFAPIDVIGSDQHNQEIEECERLANLAAAEFCVPQDLLHSFIQRKSPYFSEKDMLMFAARVKIHPSIVVGQIQHKTNKHGWLRKYQKSIRHHLLEWDVVDGWDNPLRIEL